MRGSPVGKSFRQTLGITVAEVPQYVWALFGRGDWVTVHNRLERLVAAPPPERGVACDWQWTSDLRACQLYPALGRQLLRRALRDWPIVVRDNPPPTQKSPAKPVVSYIIGHRGAEKLGHLQATISSILGQTGSEIEVIVVEQDSVSVARHLPAQVQHIHIRPSDPEMPYSRAWAFNVGARAAKGEILILHDNDLLVPASYASEAIRLLHRGDHDVAYLGRFVFYLSDNESRKIVDHTAKLSSCIPVQIMQNFLGGSMAIRRETFLSIGGFDEQFVGWGGEDNEMFDRCKTLACYRFGYLPFVHLFHPPQKTKTPERPTVSYLNSRLEIPAAERIKELRGLPFGSRTGPVRNSSPVKRVTV